MKLSREQLIRRMAIIQEDLNTLYATLKEQGVDTEVENKLGSTIDTYVSNIEICVDIDSDGVPKKSEGYRVETEWIKIGRAHV